MSLNNYILIRELKNGWSVTERDADTNSAGKPKHFKTMRSAILYGQEIEAEYGLYFKFKSGRN